MTYSDAVKKCCELEESLQLYDITIWGVPIWRALRDRYRKRFVLKYTGITPLNNHPQFNIIVLVRSYIISLSQFIYLMFCRKKVSNVLFGFPRLEKIDGCYVDKFVDPLILMTRLKDDYLYLERGRSGKHQTPRKILNILYTEFIDNSSSILSIITFPLTSVFFMSKTWKIYVRARQSFFMKSNDLLKINIVLGRLFWKSLFIYLLFKKLKVRYFFAPAMCLFYHYILVCKKMGIKCYEIQHGITTDVTTTYSGKYRFICYPDLFLAFGKSSLKNVFGVPVSNMVNIGFAFKYFIKKNCNIQVDEKAYLLLSDPEITDAMVKVAIELSKTFPDYKFYIRLHPQELLTQQQKTVLYNGNVQITDNTINSFLSIMQYAGVIGVNTSVLYEAISIGIKAACISYNNLSPDNYPNPILKNYFFVLKCKEDFLSFVNSEISAISRNYFYSDFQKNRFEELFCNFSKS